jgi:predicted nuclease of predicted toxin-antitoxin system
LKLLFDQNISFRIVKQLSSLFPDAAQVKQIGLENSSDRQIWEYAKKNSFTIVTFDADFGVLATLLGHPPKIIWLRIGNTNSNALIEYLQKRSELIKEFITSSNYADVACLELD